MKPADERIQKAVEVWTHRAKDYASEHKLTVGGEDDDIVQVVTMRFDNDYVLCAVAVHLIDEHGDLWIVFDWLKGQLVTTHTRNYVTYLLWVLLVASDWVLRAWVKDDALVCCARNVHH